MSLSFTNILSNVILENTRYEVLVNKFAKPKKKGQKPKIELDILTDLMQADPTTRGDFEGDRDTRDIQKNSCWA